MWKLACCGGSCLQILGRSGYDKWGWAVGMHKYPCYLQPSPNISPEEKEQPGPSQCLTCHWGGETLLPMPWRAVCSKKLYICLPQICKETVSLRTNHQSSADPPSSLGLRSRGISARLCVPCLTSCLCYGQTVSAVSSWLADTNKII